VSHPAAKLLTVGRSNDLEIAALAARNHGVFTLAEARAFDFTDAEIVDRMTRAWTRVHEGVFRMAGAPITWRSNCYAATRAATPPSAITDYAAAGLYELPRARNDIVEIMCRRWKRTQKPGLIVHETTRLSEQDITVVDGISVVTAELLIMRLAARKPVPDVIERNIQAARRKRLITYDSMVETFERLRRRGLPGVKALAVSLERWNPNSKATESEMETLLIQVLRSHGLPEPVTQFVVLDEFGNFVARTDAGIPQWSITIEYQSWQEHSDEFQIAADDRRRNQIIAAGYRPLHARYDDLKNGGHQLVDEIRRTARRSAS
jgi:hypothetical protein